MKIAVLLCLVALNGLLADDMCVANDTSNNFQSTSNDFQSLERNDFQSIGILYEVSYRYPGLLSSNIACSMVKKLKVELENFDRTVCSL